MSFISEPGFFDRYDDAEEICLRKYQDECIHELRANIKTGIRSQILASMVGSGKTVMGAFLLRECWQKGRRGMFIVDRLSLLDQTSAVFAKYGLPHGIIQSGHPGYRPGELIQIASIQTLARRQWPKVDLIINDEAHVCHAAMLKKIALNDAIVIGLTATPFTRGLGKHYKALVNVTTGNKLTKEGFLVPFKVWAAKEPDMTGAKVVAGEWTDEEASTRSIKIVGDVVSEYQKHGDDRKFICFGCDVNHCEELQRQFLGAGINAALYTYRTGDEERGMMLTEFRKPDSSIRGLISVAALSRGFDCIAEGQHVLTKRGNIPIDELSEDDMLWDGIEFVRHGGVIYKGERHVIQYQGLCATPDHIVATRAGWKTLQEAAEKGLGIIKTAHGEAIQKCESDFGGVDNPAEKDEQCDASSEVHGLRRGIHGVVFKSDDPSMEGMPQMQHTRLANQALSENEISLRDSSGQGFQKLWRKGDQIFVPVSQSSSRLDQGEYGSAGARQQYSVGSDQQRRPLRAGQPKMGIENSECLQYAPGRMGCDASQISDYAPRNSLFRQDASKFFLDGVLGGSNNRTIQPVVRQTKRRVWDILNAGPRNRFTCEGLLVHNCTDVGAIIMCRPLRASFSEFIQILGRGLRSHPGKLFCRILDMAGNFMRHYPAMAEFFEDGAQVLCDGKPKPKSLKSIPAEKKPKKCPKCSFVFPAGSHCPSCGYIFISRSNVQHEEGSLSEFDGTAAVKMDREAKHKLFAELRYICLRKGYKDGWSAHAYRSITGVWPSMNKSSAGTLPPSAATLRAVQALADQRAKTFRKHKPAPAPMGMELDLFA